MAAPDHTVLIRRCFATDGVTTALLHRSFVADTAQSSPCPPIPQDGIAQVLDTRIDLLAGSGACPRKQPLLWRTERSRRPFAAVSAHAIDAAMRPLHPSVAAPGLVPG